jgi:replicative DNA helicase
MAESVLISPQEQVKIAWDVAERAYKNEDIGFEFGLIDLDNAVAGGIKPGDYAVVGARPGSGKSFLIQHVLAHNAKKGYKSLLVSAEMTAAQLGIRGFSYTARIDSKDIFSGNLREEDWAKLAEAAGKRESLPIWLLAHRGVAEEKRIRRPPFTIDLIDAVMYLLLEKGIKIDLVGIDYLQRLRSNLGHTSRKDTADEISGGAKDIALKYSVPVIMTSQLGRQVEDRTPPMPLESDYKESGNVEEDADLAMSMFYPFKYYNEGEPIPGSQDRVCSKNQVYIRIHKQRGGESNIGTWVWFDPKFALLSDLEERLAFDF